jgi:isopropylmalate/homocitrate/citramalate synthase
VGPRDGLQNEARNIPTADKVAFVDRLSAAGLPVIEVTAFVNPTRVPQMADAADVAAAIERRPGTRYAALVPNLRGLERALAARVTEVAFTAATSETFSQRNINRTIDAALGEFTAVIARAEAANVPVRAYLSTAFGCPYEGAVPPSRVADLAARLIGMGAFEVAISDTIGIAHPAEVRVVLDAVLARVPAAQVALHFHDTRGMAIANVLTALDYGIRTFDASAGGLGGCPYAPGAAGNVSTEDLLFLLHGLGHPTGIDIDAVARAASALEALVGHPLPSHYVAATRAAR